MRNRGAMADGGTTAAPIDSSPGGYDRKVQCHPHLKLLAAETRIRGNGL